MQIRTLLTLIVIALVPACDSGRDAETSEPPAPLALGVDSDDEFPSSFRVRNSEIRDDILAELSKQGIPHRLNEDGSIAYREADGEAIDKVFYYAVGLYAARN